MKTNINKLFLSLLLILNLSIHTMEQELAALSKEEIDDLAQNLQQATIDDSRRLITVHCEDGGFVKVTKNVISLSETLKDMLEGIKDQTDDLHITYIRAPELEFIVTLLDKIKKISPLNDDVVKVSKSIAFDELLEAYLRKFGASNPADLIANLDNNAEYLHLPLIKMMLNKKRGELLNKIILAAGDVSISVDDLTHNVQNTTIDLSVLIVAAPQAQPTVPQNVQVTPPLIFISPYKTYKISDDVNPPSPDYGWKQVKGPHYQLPHIFTNNDHKIRNRFLYKPVGSNSNSLIVFLVVHGTFGTTTTSFFVDENKN